MTDQTIIDTLVRHLPDERSARRGGVAIRCRCGHETRVWNTEVDGPYSAENSPWRLAEHRHLEHALAAAPATDEDDGRLPGPEFRARFLADDRDHWQARAEQAEAERDEMRAMTARDLLTAAWAAGHVPEDGIIPAGAEYIARDRETGFLRGPLTSGFAHSERRLLDPPTPKRPDGAEEWDEELGEMPAASDLTAEQRARLADALAERDHALGVRVTEGGAS